jgi:hypothetical protein
MFSLQVYEAVLEIGHARGLEGEQLFSVRRLVWMRDGQ